ncbi:acetamidase/formamidase family protein [Grimontia marina]|uniref:Formamidase n=1 Tax=Grimontia marina TaxID=646534 RepID=A0A128FH28_9GAMM|nr:acetamidase/formamidase family protein [Grimontia marina]CZF86107.1 Formamidase [Grimontia marina]
MCNDSIIKTIHSVHHHHGWDNAIEPAFLVERGQTLEFECLDSSGGQLNRSSSVADIPGLDFNKINPVTGPIYVDGAKPGDVLKLTIHEFKPSGFGWTANIPGFGLLADQFKNAALNVWSYDASTLAPAAFSGIAKVPLKPFAGTIGVAPAEKGSHSVVPPRRVGGNMDIRDLSAGTTLYLPIEVEGALFSIGDTHAAQGDGEVCGTAIESPMNVVVELDVVNNLKIDSPYFTTSGPVTRHLDSKGYQVTTGVAPDLMEGAKSAVSQMIDLLVAQHHMSPEQAYMLCSVCGDLRISEIVDMPNWVVSFYLPNVVFE